MLPITTVIDTNIALDLLVFDDASAHTLGQALAQGRVLWLVTPAMREELARVLGYAHIAARLARVEKSAAQVLTAFDALAQMQAVPAKAPVTCSDADDQKFIDLAVAHRVSLLSKDAAVLCLRQRLAALGVGVGACASPVLAALALA